MTDEAIDPLEEEIGATEVALIPNDAADSQAIVAKAIPAHILARYEVHSYRSAAIILSQSRHAEFHDLLEALDAFSITTKMIRTAGGNESEIPRLLSTFLRPKGWHETVVRGDLHVSLTAREYVPGANGLAATYRHASRVITREKYLDGHKIDYVKGKVAFDLEWNSKDQTFDRDLFAFGAFAQCGVVDVGVLLTRGTSLSPVLKKLGSALKKDGSEELTKKGRPRLVHEKYGASTTWMGKLLYRLNAGRNGGCPVLALGITPACISDWGGE